MRAYILPDVQIDIKFTQFHFHDLYNLANIAENRYPMYTHGKKPDIQIFSEWSILLISQWTPSQPWSHLQ